MNGDAMNIGRTDAPESENDKLLTRQYALGLASFIEDCQTPLTIGVQGEWGSGKTSLMKMVVAALEASDRPKLITWFDTWQYGALGEDEGLGIQLLIDLNAALTSALDNDAAAQRISTRISRLLASAYQIARKVGRVGKALAAGVASYASQDLINGEVLVSDDESEPTTRVSLPRIKGLFQSLVAEYVKKQGGQSTGARVVVFVDDLDRIRPGRAVALLEVMKNFIEIEHCVFVIACDQQVVREGVRERLGLDYRDKDKVDKADAFFHKLFQVPFEMPVDAYDNTRFLQDYVRTLLSQRLTKGAKSKKNTTVDQATVIAQKVNRAITTAIGTNPRALKRYFNLSDLMLCVDKHREGDHLPPEIDTSDTYIACVYLALVAMHTKWPELAAYMAGLNTIERYQSAVATLTGGSTQDDLLDEGLESLMQIRYGSDLGDAADWRTSEKVETIGRFVRAFNQILSKRDDGILETSDLAVLQRLFRRMQLTGAHTDIAFQTPFFRFRESAIRLDPKAGDAFFGIALALETRFAKDSRFIIRRTDERYSLTIKSDFASQISPMALWLEERPNQLLLRVNLGKKTAANAGCSALVDIGKNFIENTSVNLGVSWIPNGEGYRLDFVQNRVPHSRMDEFRIAVLNLHEACAEAIATASQLHREGTFLHMHPESESDSHR